MFLVEEDTQNYLTTLSVVVFETLAVEFVDHGIGNDNHRFAGTINPLYP